MAKKVNPSGSRSLKPCRLTENRIVAPDVHLISFRREFNFVPGQVVQIAAGTDHPPRIYSICSGNRDSDVGILFNIKHEGILTPRLAEMKPGDEILVSEPYGSFTDNNEPAWWIASGTGIAPYYSMVRSGLSGNKTLIHGVRTLEHFYFREEMEKLFGSRYIRCCSRESADHVYPGRITSYLAELDDFPAVNYFLCGNALMVVEVRDILIEKGVPFGNIYSEIYF